jgi:predicted restriction endonuclease
VVDGVRCSATIGLEAHHVQAIADGGTKAVENGRAVCQHHHWLIR